MLTHSETEYIRRLLLSLGDDGSYYAAHWSTDTNIYRLMQAYAGELASGSAEVAQTYDDLFLDTCQSSRLYRNFGTYVGPTRVFEQDYEADAYSASSGSWIGYRKQCRFLWDAAFGGASYSAMDRVGHAFYGISLKIEPYRDVKRWRLVQVSGTVTSISATGFTDASKNWRHDRWDEGIAQFGTGGSSQTLRLRGNSADTVQWYDAPIGVAAGAAYKLNFSKLGTNTKLYSRAMKAKGCVAYSWAQPTAEEARVASFRTAVSQVRPAGTVIRWASGSAYVAETSAAQFAHWTSGSFNFIVQDDGSIINTAATVTR